VLLLGLLFVGFLRTWPDLRQALVPGVAPPAWAGALWLGVALPSLFLLGPAIAAAAVSWFSGQAVGQGPGKEAAPRRMAGLSGSAWADAVKRFLPAFVGLALGAHAALALVKLNAKAGYLPYLLYDPTGAATYLAIYASRLLPVPDLLIPLSALRWLASVCLALGFLAGGRELWRSRRGTVSAGRAASFYALSFAAAASLLGAALVHWLFLGRG